MNDMVEKIRQFMNERPTMKVANADPKVMMMLLRQEVDELEKAIAEEPTENQHKELLDILWFALTMAILWDMDIPSVFATKYARNSRKYDATQFQDGNYEETYRRIKAEWTED